MVLTPRKQQLRQRELWWEGSWTANLCTEVHEAHMSRNVCEPVDWPVQWETPVRWKHGRKRYYNMVNNIIIIWAKT